MWELINRLNKKNVNKSSIIECLKEHKNTVLMSEYLKEHAF